MQGLGKRRMPEDTYRLSVRVSSFRCAYNVACGHAHPSGRFCSAFLQKDLPPQEPCSAALLLQVNCCCCISFCSTRGVSKASHRDPNPSPKRRYAAPSPPKKASPGGPSERLKPQQFRTATDTYLALKPVACVNQLPAT